VVPLSDAWAERRFAICFRSEANLSPAAKLLVAHLRDRAAAQRFFLSVAASAGGQ
jgi:hypothetical protein